MNLTDPGTSLALRPLWASVDALLPSLLLTQNDSMNRRAVPPIRTNEAFVALRVGAARDLAIEQAQYRPGGAPLPPKAETTGAMPSGNLDQR